MSILSFIMDYPIANNCAEKHNDSISAVMQI